MPLMHSKTPKAFKKNIKTEIESGKEPKQAVAIAYHEKEEAEHKHAKGGEICMACGGKPHMDTGGQVSQPSQPIDRTKNVAGGTVKGATGADITSPKTWWAKGGDVQDDGEQEESEPSEHMNLDDDEVDGEISEALGHEFMNAIESKEPKKIMESLEACVLSCMMKGSK